MNEEIHTPWTAEEPYDDSFFPITGKWMRCDIIDATGHLIAKRVPVEVAPLVIAAPSLLEACKAMHKALVEYSWECDDGDYPVPARHREMMRKAAEAIAAAEGSHE